MEPENSPHSQPEQEIARLVAALQKERQWTELIRVLVQAYLDQPNATTQGKLERVLIAAALRGL